MGVVECAGPLLVARLWVANISIPDGGSRHARFDGEVRLEAASSNAGQADEFACSDNWPVCAPSNEQPS
jgi:hypothetical protein